MANKFLFIVVITNSLLMLGLVFLCEDPKMFDGFSWHFIPEIIAIFGIGMLLFRYKFGTTWTVFIFLLTFLDINMIQQVFSVNSVYIIQKLIIDLPLLLGYGYEYMKKRRLGERLIG